MTADISTHEWTITYSADGSPVVLPVVDGTLTLDNKTFPFVQAQVVVPFSSLVFDATDLDPRDDVTVELTATRTTASGNTPSSTRTWTLYLNSVHIDVQADAMILDLYSEEQRWFEKVNMTEAPLVGGASDLRAVFAAVSAYFPGAQPLATDEGDNFSFSGSDNAGWAVGQTAWDYIKRLADAGGFSVYNDGTSWHVQDARRIVSGEGAAFAVGNTESFRVSLSRETWADSVMLRYRWRSDFGDIDNEVWAFDSFTDDPMDHTKAAVLEQYETAYPGTPLAATAIRRRYISRGYQATCSAVSDYRARPYAAFSATVPNIGNIAGVCDAVLFNIYSDTMTVTSREVIDSPDSSWVNILAGDAWNEIPVGDDWTEFVD